MKEDIKPTAPDFAGEPMKMPENFDTTPTIDIPAETQVVNAPLLITLVILLLVILGGMYYWFFTLNATMPDTYQAPTVENTVTTPAPAPTTPPPSTAANSSDELDSIQSDLNTDTGNIDEGLKAVDAEINATAQ